LQNNLSLTILNNPNHIDGLSSSELMDQIAIGQNKFSELCAFEIVAVIGAFIEEGIGADIAKEISTRLSADPRIALAQLYQIIQMCKE
jgi:hypothetical protein